MTARVKLHDFKGLYVLRFGGGRGMIHGSLYSIRLHVSGIHEGL